MSCGFSYASNVETCLRPVTSFLWMSGGNDVEEVGFALDDVKPLRFRIRV